ncbi:MAG: sigma-70 family RNA polymerase sigma factor [Saprospiraceae bacterium]
MHLACLFIRTAFLMIYINKSEDELLQLYYQEDDIKALEILLKKLQKKVEYTCLYFLKNESLYEDVASDIMVKIYEQLTRKHPIKTSIKSWVFIITRNESWRILKENQHLHEFIEEFTNIKVHNMEFDEDLTLYSSEDDIFTQLDKYLLNLSDKQQLCLTAHYWEGKSYNTIAVEFGISVGEVKSALQNARRNLKKMLGLKQ